jgi:peptidoglycan/LPS O-acetylase OafA/YrhL
MFVHRRVTPRVLLQLAFWAFVLFAALRWLDGFGNQQLHRRSDDWLEWLHCSKYPPSITYFAMELGIAFVLLAALTAAERALERLPKWNPIEALGRTALFFYLVHIPMIGVLMLLGVLTPPREGSAARSWLGALCVVLACWPLCLCYGWYKRRWRHRWTRFL